MKLPYQYQPSEIEALKARLQAHGINYSRLAREMNRSYGGIVRAFQGDRMTLLTRIERWLKRYERRKKDTKSNGHMAA